MNSVVLIGRTTADIDLSYTPQTQTAIGRFTLAVDRMKREDGSDFIRCKVWGHTAENMSRYVKKGHKVAVSGRIETGSYKNRAGVTVYTTEVVVDRFEFLETKNSERPRTNEAPNNDDTLKPAGSPIIGDKPNQAEPQIFDDMPDAFDAVEDDIPF